MINWISAIGGAVIAAAATFTAMSTYTGLVTIPAVKAETRAVVEAEARERALELIEKRNADNAEISTFDMRALCVELGGKWVQPDRCD